MIYDIEYRYWICLLVLLFIIDRTLKSTKLSPNSGNHKDIINKFISSVMLLCFYFDGRTATQTFCLSQDAHMNLINESRGRRAYEYE